MLICIEEFSSERKETLASLETDDQILGGVAAAWDGTKTFIKMAIKSLKKDSVSCLNLSSSTSKWNKALNDSGRKTATSSLPAQNDLRSLPAPAKKHFWLGFLLQVFNG
jgi:hypothetical protein